MRYLISAGCHYYPESGFSDIQGCADCASEAVMIAQQLAKQDWVSILDTTMGIEVAIPTINSRITAPCYGRLKCFSDLTGPPDAKKSFALGDHTLKMAMMILDGYQKSN